MMFSQLQVQEYIPIRFLSYDDNGTQTETSSVSFEVTEFEYARDNAGMTGDYSGGSYVNDAGTEQRGNVFDIYADATIYAI